MGCQVQFVHVHELVQLLFYICLCLEPPTEILGGQMATKGHFPIARHIPEHLGGHGSVLMNAI